MKLYPWLNKSYNQIINAYLQGRGHHALLINSQQNQGEISLIYKISCWLICCNPVNINNCKICHSCKLMEAGNHPDYYNVSNNQIQSSIGIDNIRIIINNIFNHAHQGHNKVICLHNIELLTEQASNCLLKIIEEPPLNTYFILQCQDRDKILPTLISRCLVWSIPLPLETLGLYWLNKEKKISNSISAIIALRLCNNSPIAACNLIQSKYWNIRISFYKLIMKCIINNNFLILLPIMLNCNNDISLYWLLSLFIDVLKWKKGSKNFLINLDQTNLINLMATKWSCMILYHQLQNWLQCYHQYNQVSAINRELLFTYYLIHWEQDFII